LAYLAELGLVINQPEPFLVCTLCEQAILPKRLSYHLNTKHNSAQVKIDHRKFDMICLTLGIQDYFPSIQPGIKAFQSLPTFSGFQCSNCVFSSANIKKVQKHFKTEHSNLQEPTTFSNVILQRLQKAPFVVDISNLSSPLPVPTILSAASVAAQKITTTNFQPQQPNTRLISPWLQATNWHNEIKDKDIIQLCKEVEYPDPKEFPGLKEAIMEYIKHCSSFIEETQNLVLEILNTKEDDG
jgi:hypothetical protein